MSTQIDARKEVYAAEDAWQLLQGAPRVIVAKGKTIKDLGVTDKNRDDILKMVMGPSGKLRAPTFKVGEYYVVGFNDDMYATTLK